MESDAIASYATNADFAAQCSREAAEHARAEAAAVARRQAQRVAAEQLVATLSADEIARGADEGYRLADLFYPEHSARVEELEQAFSTLHRTYANNGVPLPLAQRVRVAEQLEPLESALPEARALLGACRDVALRRVQEVFAPLIAEQCRRRAKALDKARPFNDRVRTLERLCGQLGVATGFSSRVLLDLDRWTEM